VEREGSRDPEKGCDGGRAEKDGKRGREAIKNMWEQRRIRRRVKGTTWEEEALHPGTWFTFCVGCWSKTSTKLRKTQQL